MIQRKKEKGLTLVPKLQVTHEKLAAGARKSILEITNTKFSVYILQIDMMPADCI